MDRQHNPNHPSRNSTPSYTPFSQPPPPQIAPQQPTADPFPKSSSDFFRRRDSQTANGRMLSSFDIPQPPSFPRTSPPLAYTSERRNSLEDRFAGGLVDSGPPPPQLSSSTSHQQGSSFFGRSMLPPAVSPKDNPSQAHSTSFSRAPLAASASNSKPRESGQRSGSMSIQSLIGSDSGPPNSQSGWSSGAGRSPTTTATAASLTHPSSPSERRYNAKKDIDGESAPLTPIRRPDGPPYAAYERPPASITSPSARSNNPYQPPDRDTQGFSRLLRPFHHPTTENTSDTLPGRPYSQPSSGETHTATTGPFHYESRAPQSTRDGYVGGTFEKAVRERALADTDRKRDSPVNHPLRPPVEAFSPVTGTPLPPPPHPVHATYQPRPMDYRDSLLNGSDATREDSTHSSSDRIAASSGAAQPSLPGQSSSLNTTSESMPYGNGIGQTEDPNRLPRPLESQNTRTPPMDSQLHKSIEETNRQSFSRFSSDIGRRPDRSSPLPQAVQGAQSQPAGLARDPGIKSEFARMFSGLGSGVGSTPQPLLPHLNGAGTPRRSPDEGTADLERPGRRGGHTAGGGRGSRGGRRGAKRTYPEDSRPESDDGDGRVTPLPSARGAKRNRYLQHSTGHHHHHHPQGPHHHHYPRKPEDATAFPLNRRGSGTSHSSFKFPTSGTTGLNNPTPHHHHHHHSHPNTVPHHHHHPPKLAADTRVPPPKMTVSTSPVLRSVAHLPRQHLGSQLYEPTVSPPAAGSSTIYSPINHQGINNPNLIPRFSRSTSNCTYTIRVPRYFLSETERERICKARHLWGTDVYTDDSDPLAAAFHSGWIRGAWTGDVDVAVILGLASADSIGGKPKNGLAAINQTETGPVTLTEPPASGPVLPPPNYDLHLTLLLLPPLEKYTGSIWHGIKSRGWGDNHDGLSFKIEKIEWVDEGIGSRWQERGVDSKRRRIADAIASSKNIAAVTRSGTPNGVRAIKNGLKKKTAATSTITTSAVAT